jgi:predicted metal-dependent TIM-barrel fold hydrolase
MFDAHLHPEALSDQDLESMAFFGVTSALALAHHAPAERRVKHLFEHFDDLLGRQLPRLERAGIHGWAALGVHPLSAPARGLPEVLAALPGYLRGGKVVAVGEVGLHRGGEAEEEALVEQLALAAKLRLPVVVHSPHQAKEKLTRRMLNLILSSAVAPGRVLVDHASPRTVQPILACGFWAGLTVHPDELGAEKAVALVRRFGTERVVLNSDSGDGAGDILALPRAVRLLEKAQLSAAVVSRVAEENARRFLKVPKDR